jgi:hypothetical protein
MAHNTIRYEYDGDNSKANLTGCLLNMCSLTDMNIVHDSNFGF